jgi:hypothetical protein
MDDLPLETLFLEHRVLCQIKFTQSLLCDSLSPVLSLAK